MSKEGNMSTKRALLTILAASAVLLALGIGSQLAEAQPPAQQPVPPGVTIPYPGRLNDAAGQPVPDGAYDFTFTLYAAETGGESLWSEVQKGVPVQGGAFNVPLGSAQPIPPAALTGNDLPGTDRQTLWLEVAVRGPSEAAFTALAPRQRVSAAAPAAPDSASAGLACPHDHLGEVWNASIGWSNAALRINNSANGPALWGYNSGGGNGVRGESTTSLGVYGWSNSSSGVAGRSSGGNGVEGYSPAAGKAGVYGKNEASSAGSAYGVMGETSSGDGSAAGVYGYAPNGYAIGVYGYTMSPNGWAGMFGSPNGNGVKISVGTGKTGLVVSGGGTKSAAVRTDDGDRLLYTEESTQVWFSDYGFGTLQNGVAVILIDPLFAQTVNLQEPYHVFLQAYGDAELYVTDRTPTQFQVRLRAGEPNVEFSYRIVAKRLGYEEHRLEPAP